VRSDGTNKVSLKAGEHLYAQTIHAFGYLRRRLDAGEIAMPDGSLGRNSFGREAIKNREAAGSADPTLMAADSGAGT
jgi:hypothetical protein